MDNNTPNRIEIVNKYLKKSSQCPFCDGEIEGQSVDVDEGGAFQEVSCIDCGRSWVDTYCLTGINRVVDDDGREILDDASLDMPGILEAILSKKELLPLLKGLHTELDELIAEGLKDA